VLTGATCGCGGQNSITVGGYVGDFLLATSVEGHPVETLVHVSVPARHRSRLVLAFSDDQVEMDARVLLCGHIGAMKLQELGYTGPLPTRPRLTGRN
jgi:hypothetical protein